MAQTARGFPWQGPATEPNPILSEKVGNSTRNNSGVDTTAVQQQVPRVPTEKPQRYSSKSRKRATSVKVATPVIPQTREELDVHLAYGASHHYNVRTIPPWVRDAEEDDVIDEIDDDAVLDSPHRALVAQHNSNPANTQRTGRHERLGPSGRFATSSGAQRTEKTSRWITFARGSIYPRENFHSEKVDTDWLNKNFTDYSKPWLAGREDDLENGDGRYGAFRRKRQNWTSRWRFIILRNPFVPLAFRFVVIVFAAIAIGLGASIYHEAGFIEHCQAQPIGSRDAKCDSLVGQREIDYYRDPSSLMAVIVDAIAIVYTMYITYDEYFSKPLGLRPARAKVRLVLLDLFFIVFQSANLSLAFEALTVDDGACYVGSKPDTSYKFDRICDRAEALSSVLLISLVAWLLTFCVSVLRLVERINTK